MFACREVFHENPKLKAEHLKLMSKVQLQNLLAINCNYWGNLCQPYIFFAATTQMYGWSYNTWQDKSARAAI